MPANSEGSSRHVWETQGMLAVSPFLTSVSSPVAAGIPQDPRLLSVLIAKYKTQGKHRNSHVQVSTTPCSRGHHPHKCLTTSCPLMTAAASTVLWRQTEANLFSP